MVLDVNRIEYANNEFAFRKRVKNEVKRIGGDANISTGNDIKRVKNLLNLPFMNFYLINFGFGKADWWNNVLFSRGRFISELNDAKERT